MALARRHRYGGIVQQAVFFDAFNTLFSFQWFRNEEPGTYPLPRTCERVIHNLDASLQAAYGRARAGQPGDAGWLTRLFAGLADRSGLAHTGPMALLRRQETIFRRWLAVYTDTLSALQALSQTCQLGIISNAWPYLEPLLDLLGIREYFGSVIISAKVGFSKPSPAIFRLALKSLQVPAEEAIFVDDMAGNVVAAQQLGLRALWLVRTPLRESSIPAHYRNLERIESLSQLAPLIAGT
jgi:HAD superfamily hydrolase (TIGR01509 family)